MRSTGRLRASAATALALLCGSWLMACTGSSGDPSATDTTAGSNTTAAAPTTTTTTTTTTTVGVDASDALRWVAIGDSYSAGIGGSLARVERVAGRCPRAEADSYAVRAAAQLNRGDTGERSPGSRPGPDRPIELTVAACGGALVGDLEAQLDAAGVPDPLTVPDRGDPDRGGLAAPDVVTLTIGGNDAGFFDLTRRCLAGDCPDLAADDADLALVRDDRDDRDGNSDSGGGDGGDRSDWQVLADALSEQFSAILARLNPGGRLLVLTYPLPFPQQQGACPTGFAFLAPDDAAVVNAAITRLDDTLVDAALRAQRESTEGRQVTVLEWRSPAGVPPTERFEAADGTSRRFGWNPAGICGEDPMLNGLNLQAEVADSFHPSDRGLDIAAELVATAIGAERDGG